MRSSSKISLVVAVLLIGVGLFLYFGRPAELSPEASIERSIRDAELGAEHRSANRIMESISDDFHAGLWDKRRLYLQVVRSLRDGRGTDYQAHLTHPKILPSPNGRPNERLVLSRLSIFESGSGEDLWGSGDLTLVMRQESRPHLLVFRESYWRIVTVGNLPPVLDGGL